MESLLNEFMAMVTQLIADSSSSVRTSAASA